MKPRRTTTNLSCHRGVKYSFDTAFFLLLAGFDFYKKKYNVMYICTSEHESVAFQTPRLDLHPDNSP